MQALPIEESEQVPATLINYISRTRENVVLSDATREDGFTKDAYIIKNQPKSVLGLPLLNRGMLNGILYLENNLTTGAFTTDRLQVITLLAFQAGISLENARLFEEKQKSAEELTEEVAERKQAETDLQAQEEKFRSISENAPVGIFLTDADGKTTYWNQLLCDITGMKNEEGFGEKWVDGVHPDDKERVFKEWYKSTEARSRFKMEYRFVDKEGNVTWTIGQAAPMKNGQGQLIGFSGTLTDITERKLAEEALRVSVEKYRLLVDNQTDLLVKVDREGRFQFVSPSYCKMFGKADEELLGKAFMPLVHPDDRESTAKELEKLYHPPHTAYLEQRAMTKDGWRWQAWLNTAVLNEKNEVEATVAVGRDINNQKQAEKTLVESEKKHREMIANISDVIGILDIDGTIKYKSPNIKKWFDWRPEDLVGTDGWETVHPDDLDRVQTEFFTLLKKENSTTTVEYRYKCKDGSYKMIELTAVNLVKDSIVSGILINYHDITERKRAEEEKKKLQTQLQQAQKIEAIGTLAGGIAHDFNNLLMAIQGHPIMLLSRKNIQNN